MRYRHLKVILSGPVCSHNIRLRGCCGAGVRGGAAAGRQPPGKDLGPVP